eukprot:6176916-Pleurochrysis_carterae.AAC.3
MMPPSAAAVRVLMQDAPAISGLPSSIMASGALRGGDPRRAWARESNAVSARRDLTDKLWSVAASRTRERCGRTKNMYSWPCSALQTGKISRDGQKGLKRVYKIPLENCSSLKDRTRKRWAHASQAQEQGWMKHTGCCLPTTFWVLCAKDSSRGCPYASPKPMPLLWPEGLKLRHAHRSCANM